MRPIAHKYLKVIASQYSNAVNLLGILAAFGYRVDPEEDILDFFVKIFDLNTANEEGLRVWGGIVQAPDMITVLPEDYLGFYNTGYEPFNQAPFFSGQRDSREYPLESEVYRALIFFKGMINIMGTTAPQITEVLNVFFKIRGYDKQVYVFDQLDMSISIRIPFYLSEIDRAIFRTYWRLPRPGGVRMYLIEMDPDDVFGFEEAGYQPFGQAPFYDGSIVQL